MWTFERVFWSAISLGSVGMNLYLGLTIAYVIGRYLKSIKTIGGKIEIFSELSLLTSIVSFGFAYATLLTLTVDTHWRILTKNFRELFLFGGFCVLAISCIGVISISVIERVIREQIPATQLPQWKSDIVHTGHFSDYIRTTFKNRHYPAEMYVLIILLLLITDDKATALLLIAVTICGVITAEYFTYWADSHMALPTPPEG